MEMSQRALALLAKNVVWRSAAGPKTLEQMSLNHIRACIKQGEGCDELEEYCGLTRDEWKAVFEYEIERRTKSIELAMAKQEVSSLKADLKDINNKIAFHNEHIERLLTEKDEVSYKYADAVYKLESLS